MTVCKSELRRISDETNYWNFEEQKSIENLMDKNTYS